MFRLGRVSPKVLKSCAQSVRQMHLKPSGASDLLSKNVSPGVQVSHESSVVGGILIKLIASRQLHVPALEGETKDGITETLKLDILDPALPSTVGTWLGRLGVAQADHQAAHDTLQALWTTWLDNGLLRLTANLHTGNQPNLSEVTVVADDFALPQHPELKQLETEDIHPLELQAREGKLFYHKSRNGGNIGCLGYGAGIAMSTMDMLQRAGGKPANFLDGGGGATEANVQAALDVVLGDNDVTTVFVNSFGGLTKMDIIARGVITNLRRRKEAGESIPPMVLRLRGTNEILAQDILKEATDLSEIEYIADAKTAAEKAVTHAGKWAKPTAKVAASAFAHPVSYSRDGQYQQTLNNLVVKKDDPVMVLGLGKAAQSNCQVASDYGTNIVGFTAPKKGGQSFIDKPVFNSVREGVEKLRPRIASVFVPPQAAADSIIECIEAEIPLIVSYAEGIPTHQQLKVQRALHSQSKSRLVGANCPGVIFPHQRVKLGIQPLMVHSPGSIGIVSRSGTISYELAQQTTTLGLGQSVVYGLGGDPFPGTRTWEAVQLMINDPLTKVICVVGEIGGQMEEEAADAYQRYVKSLLPGEKPKPAVAFVAGEATQRGLTYGHAGATWWKEQEQASVKAKRFEEAGFVLAPTIGDIGGLLKEAYDNL